MDILIVARHAGITEQLNKVFNGPATTAEANKIKSIVPGGPLMGSRFDVILVCMRPVDYYVHEEWYSLLRTHLGPHGQLIQL